MSRTVASTLHHQWNPFEILEVQQNGQCVGMAHSKRRKCYNTVNRSDVYASYRLLTELSSQPLNTAVLLPQLRVLASLGLCKQVHRWTQIDEVVEDWTRKINDAVVTAELRAAMQNSGTLSLIHI